MHILIDATTELQCKHDICNLELLILALEIQVSIMKTQKQETHKITEIIEQITTFEIQFIP